MKRMEPRGIEAWIALTLIPGIGNRTISRLIEYFEDAEIVFEASLDEIADIDGSNMKIAEKIFYADVREKLDEEQYLLDQCGVRVVTIKQAEYPALLKSIFSPPPLLYVKGKLTGEDRNSIAIVGTRRATSYGRFTAGKLAQELAELGITVVSGLARGIDSCAHWGTLKQNGRTIAVLGNGLSRVYPPENRELLEQIATSGAVVSEFPMKTAPESHNFPIRNRIISGLSLGTVVVEAGKKSGSLITASAALEQGREVFAVPGYPTAKTSRGSNWLIKQGAKLMDCVEDILEEIAPQLKGISWPPEKKKVDAHIELTSEEEKLFSFLAAAPVHIDTIIQKLELPANKVLGLLTVLEMKGAILQLEGNIFCQRG